MGFDTYDRITSQMVPSSNSLVSHCLRRTRRMVDSYSNFFVLQSIGSQYILGDLIYSLSLSISLRVISRTKVQLGVQGFVQPFPEFQNKLDS
jgi:hypothetical protein